MKNRVVALIISCLLVAFAFTSCDANVADAVVGSKSKLVEITFSSALASEKTLTASWKNATIDHYLYKMTWGGDTETPASTTVADNNVQNPTGNAYVVLKDRNGSTYKGTAGQEAVLGWATQGYWHIEVKGMGADDEELFFGETTQYVSVLEPDVTIYLMPVKATGTGYLYVDKIASPALTSEARKDEYYFEYSLDGGSTLVALGNADINDETGVATTVAHGPADFTTKDDAYLVDAGEYTFTIYMRKTSDHSLLGTSSRKVVVAKDAITIVSGSFEACDFIRAGMTLKAVSLSVDGFTLLQSEKSMRVMSSDITYSINNYKYSQISEENGDSITYEWLVNGEVAGTEAHLVKLFSQPGYKNVTCNVTVTLGSLQYADGSPVVLRATAYYNQKMGDGETTGNQLYGGDFLVSYKDGVDEDGQILANISGLSGQEQF